MIKIGKQDVINLIAELKLHGLSYEELAVALNKTHQTIWAWSSLSTKRVPCKSDFLVLKRLLERKK